MSKASAYFTLEKLGGSHGAKEIKKELGGLPGVLSVSVSEDANCAAVDYDTTGIQAGRIQKQLEQLGCQVVDTRVENHVM